MIENIHTIEANFSYDFYKVYISLYSGLGRLESRRAFVRNQYDILTRKYFLRLKDCKGFM